LRAPKHVPLDRCYLTPCAAGELPDSHPGGSAVAHVLDQKQNVLLTVASLYGQWEMRPGSKDMDATPRLHRMLSDLTSVFANSKIPIVLGGDWNISTQGAKSQETKRPPCSLDFVRGDSWMRSLTRARGGCERQSATAPIESAARTRKRIAI
jgi:hypothetical protein